MLVKLHPKKLRKHLWRYGPFIYFYNGNGEAENKPIYEKIQEMAKTYYKLNIFEINFLDKMIYNPFTLSEESNNVYLYCCGILVEKLQKPDKKEIEELFIKAVKYHNQVLERKAKNVGTQPKIDYFDRNYDTNQIRTRYRLMNVKRNYLLKGKIKLPPNLDNEYSKCDNQLKLENLTPKDNFVNSPTISKISSKPWFHDVKIHDLPTEIMLDKRKQIIENKNNIYDTDIFEKPSFKKFCRELELKKRSKINNMTEIYYRPIKNVRCHIIRFI